MDPIERAIRSALEKGDAADRAFREKVYRQAFAALERALQANPGVTVETAIRRRKGLQTKITEIEAEYLPAAQRAGPSTAAPAPAEPTEWPSKETASDEPDMAPEIEVAAGDDSAGDGRVDPVIMPGSEDAVELPVAPDVVVETQGGATPQVPDIMAETQPEIAPIQDLGPARPAPRKRRPFAMLLVAVILLCLAAMGVWWGLQTGLIGGAQTEDPGAGMEAPAESESYEPGAEGAPATAGQPDPQQNWINVFVPAQPSTVSTPGDAKADAMEDGNGAFMRIRSGPSGSAVLFDVGQGVLRQIAGKKATFNIVARAEDGKDTQMSIACNFGELGDCGRKRYAVGAARADYLFEVDVPQGDPGAGGTIAINSDFENTGKAVDVFEVKVSVQ